MVQNQEKIVWSQFLQRIYPPLLSIDIGGITHTAAAYTLAKIYRLHRKPVAVVLPCLKSAEKFFDQLSFFLKDLAPQVLIFPPYNILPFKFVAYHNETAARRIRTLYQIIEGQSAPLIVTTATAMMQKLVPKNELINYGELLMAGEEVDYDGMIRKLVAGGYTRSMIVEEPGDFSMRGGILDIFSPLYEDPVRVEFFGDHVESIRFFSATTQRTIQDVREVVILPSREAIVSRAELDTIIGRVRARSVELAIPSTRVREMIQRIKTKGIFPGIESLMPLIYTRLDTFFDYLPQDTLYSLVSPGQSEAAADEFDTQTRQGYKSACEQHYLCVEPDELYLSWQQIKARLKDLHPISFKALPTQSNVISDQSSRIQYNVRIQETTDVSQSLRIAAKGEASFQPLVDWIKQQKEAGQTTLIVCCRPSHLQRLPQILESYDIQIVNIENLADMVAGQGRVYITAGVVEAGFCWPDEALTLISDEEIFGTAFRSRKTVVRTRAANLLNVEDLKQADLVVHAEHGIGRFEGLVKLRLNGTVNDFLLIFYKDDDKLYLPVERMNLVQKYIGVDGLAPVLDKMGGKTWQRVKRKIKRSTEKIAGELLKLYAARKVQKGHAFGRLDTYFQDFEDGFAFEETPDQSKAIYETLMDMRQPVPMDRLICGDVGYGKTEVALRATFLAVSEAKQVAVMVPTTILAEQHYVTFKARFKRYPVRIACLSRFRSSKQQRSIVDELKQGTLDIVIGTHRLLQKDVIFKDLGLLVLDEEHRFGVRHKEKIKKMRATVHALTLTATPIPRTLHLSLLGIRDISVISTPPEQRRPIITYICELDDIVVTEAIRKEMIRGGQIFFIHNRVRNIQRIADHLQTLVPEVRLSVAHGQMPEDQLEKVMYAFMQREIDMLVCTTIVESGLDVTGANTILINRADYFGLAQIYQLRGRVGRADEQAYAYLFIPNESALTQNAQKRLKVLMEYSDLGSGFQIAMSDLKIRGGGTILGASQSGHIAAVGYDMFLQLMETSIAELKGEPIQEELEPEINLPMSAYLPESYVPDIDQRLSLYRRLAKMTDLKAISAFKAEMEDRFGLLPDEAANLLLKIMLKILAVRAGCKRLDLTNTHLVLQFSEIHQKKPFGILEMITANGDRYRFTPDHVFKAKLMQVPSKALFAQVKNILIEIVRHVNPNVI